MGIRVYIRMCVCVRGGCVLPTCENVDFCVYMRVCKCDCMCVSMIACVGVRVRAHMCTSMCVCVCLCVYLMSSSETLLWVKVYGSYFM